MIRLIERWHDRSFARELRKASKGRKWRVVVVLRVVDYDS